MIYYPVSDQVWKKSGVLLSKGLVQNVYRRKDASVSADVGSLGRDNVYYAVGLEPDQTVTCGCRGFISTDEPCSHVVAVVRYLEEIEGIIYNVFDKRYRRNYRVSFMQTSLENVNTIMGLEEPIKIEGGLPEGIVLGLTADAETGKSIMVLQFMYEVIAKTQQNAIILQTESGGGIGDIYMLYWGQIFGERFGVKDLQVRELSFVKKRRKGTDRTRVKFKFKKYDETKPVLFVANYTDSDKILEMLGRKIKFEIGGTGKITPVYDLDELLHVSETGFGKFIENHDIGFMAIDSVTEPINQFIGGLKNYPGRHEAVNLWMRMIRDYASFYKLVMIGTHHETVMGFGQAKKQTKEIKGGKAIRHAFKFNLLLEAMTKTQGRPHGVKRIGMERHPYRAPLADIRFLLLDDYGYHDMESDPQYDKILQNKLIDEGKMVAPKKRAKKKTKDDDVPDEDWRTAS